MKKLELYKGNVYHYLDEAGVDQIGIYICNTNLGRYVCMVPLFNKQKNVRTYRIKNLKKVAYPTKFFELNKQNLKLPLRLKKKTVKISYKEYLYLSNFILGELIKKTATTYATLSRQRLTNLNEKNYQDTENYYKYLTWFDYKTKLQFEKTLKSDPKIIKKGIYYVEIGENIGSELHKLRPCIIYKKFVSKKNINDSSYIIIPISSQKSNHNFSFNTRLTINGKTNYAKINDLRRVSIKRIIAPLTDNKTQKPLVIDQKLYDTIRENIIKCFG